MYTTGKVRKTWEPIHQPYSVSYYNQYPYTVLNNDIRPIRSTYHETLEGAMSEAISMSENPIDATNSVPVNVRTLTEIKIMEKPGGVYCMSGIDTTPSPFRPSHYHDAPFDVITTQGYICSNFRNATDKKLLGDGEADRDARVWCVGAAVKHLARLGKKDDVFKELEKAENYIHYARTGEWLE